jgi:hypothetical protein
MKKLFCIDNLKHYIIVQQTDEHLKNNTFMYTSYSISSPVNFINERIKCCIKNIILIK